MVRNISDAELDVMARDISDAETMINAKHWVMV